MARDHENALAAAEIAVRTEERERMDEAIRAAHAEARANADERVATGLALAERATEEARAPAAVDVKRHLSEKDEAVAEALRTLLEEQRKVSASGAEIAALRRRIEEQEVRYSEECAASREKLE